MTILADALREVGFQEEKPVEYHRDLGRYNIKHDASRTANIRVIRVYLAKDYPISEYSRFIDNIRDFLRNQNVPTASKRQKLFGAADVLAIEYKQGQRNNGCKSWVAIKCRSAHIGEQVLNFLNDGTWRTGMSIIDIALVEHINDYYSQRNKSKARPETNRSHTGKLVLPEMKIVRIEMTYRTKTALEMVDLLRITLGNHGFEVGKSSVLAIRVSDSGNKSNRKSVINIECQNFESAQAIHYLITKIDWPSKFQPVTVKAL